MPDGHCDGSRPVPGPQATKSLPQSGVGVPFSWGTRNESRAYVGVSARFGRVRLDGVEGIELDPEGYEVWFVHDKAFLQFQTTF